MLAITFKHNDADDDDDDYDGGSDYDDVKVKKTWSNISKGGNAALGTSCENVNLDKYECKHGQI